jgi:hypothetical protein
MQNHKTAPRQRFAANLRAEVMKFGNERRRNILFPKQIRPEEGRNESRGRAFVRDGRGAR